MKLVRWPVEADAHKHVYHWCPACEKLHVLPDRWTRTGPDHAPTYSPSFLQYDVMPEGNCHYIITDGFIQFCPDSWHKRDDRIAMPDVPEAVLARLTDAVFDREIPEMSNFAYQILSPKLIVRRGWHFPAGAWTHAHMCPACNQIHDFAVDQAFRNGAKWSYDGNAARPTFQPSMNIRIGPFPKERDSDPDRFEVCHYFVKDGQIQYLPDCTHAMAGQTVELPDVPVRTMNAREVGDYVAPARPTQPAFGVPAGTPSPHDSAPGRRPIYRRHGAVG